ncbi:hypothetical protein [Confluentibacter lentus]|nr:hypothetical protein [Confluentibacter lentus]
MKTFNSITQKLQFVFNVNACKKVMHTIFHKHNLYPLLLYP